MQKYIVIWEEDIITASILTESRPRDERPAVRAGPAPVLTVRHGNSIKLGRQGNWDTHHTYAPLPYR